MSEQYSVLIDSRSRFETGVPGGVWLSLPAAAEQLHDAMKSVGITTDNPQDFFINGFANTEGCPFDVPLSVIQNGSMDELNYLASLLDMLRDEDREKFAAAVTLGERAGNLKDLINLAQNLDCYWLYPTVQSEEDYGYYLIDELDEMELPEEAKKYFMYEEYGRDAAINDGGRFTEQGYIYNNKNTFSEWYNGRDNDIPEEYRIMGYPQPTEDRDATATIPAQAAEPKPVIPIILTSQKPGEKMKEITDRLEQGIMGIFESERYADYLRTMSKFHNYSFNNTLLIAMQGGSLVKGYTQWEKEFDRHVKPGEKAIKIIAPAPYKVKKQVDKIDPDTKKPVIGKDGKPVTEEQEITIPAFKVVSVFDVSQTEGKELPDLGVSELVGDVERYKDFFAALEKTSPFAIDFEQTENTGIKGRCNYEERRIAISEGMSELQNIKTAIHEIAHATMHDLDRDAPDKPDRRTREVQAESVAFAVCQYYGLDTSDYSFGYVAGWSSGRELAELKSSLETIRSTAANLIETINGHFAELQQAQEQTAEQEQTAPEVTEEQTQESPVFDKLTPEQQETLTDTVKATLQTLVDVDIQTYGEVTAGTQEAIAAQGYTYRDGSLEKLTGQTQEAQPEAAVPAPEQTAGQETAQTTATYYTINETAARRAKEANSYSDYKPGSATAEYRQYVDEAVQLAERQKKRVDPSFHEKIDRLLDTYARKLAENMNSRFSIDARVPSILIAGGSNFPVRKKEKQNAARDKNWGEWKEIQGLLDKIRSTGMGGISADDPNAVARLEKKLAGLEKAQETMKAVNAYYRKHKTLDGCPVLTPEQIEQAKADMSNSWRVEDKPYPTWALSNNNAEIRRVKERIAALTRQKEVGYVGWEFEGGKVEANTQDNRLQIFFDEKPDADIRAELKGNGFKWAPSAEAWQRQLNDNAIYAADRIKCIAPITGERPTEIQKRARQEAAAQAQTAAQPQEIDSDAPPQEQPEIPVPDATISIKEMQNYGYSWEGMLPLKQEAAERLFTQDDMAIFRIYEDNTEGAVTDLEDLREHAANGGLFGVEKDAWEALHEYNAMKQQLRESEPTKEALLLHGEKDSYGIYQLAHSDGTRDLRFEPYDRLQAAGHTVDRANYELIYTAPLTADTTLGSIWEKFNIDHPKDFKGHSLSVSDIVVLHQNGENTAHYVDSIGFQKVPEFLEPQNHLKAIEDTVEQNDNHFDGIINNTPTVDELEAKVKAGEQISLVDLANAVKADRERKGGKEEKPSIRAQLKADKERAAQKKPAKAKNQDLEV